LYACGLVVLNVISLIIEMCAKGDDPLTVDQEYYKFRFQVDHQGYTPSGYIGLVLDGKTAEISLSQPSSASCLASLQASGAYGYAACDYTYGVDYLHFNITVYSWPTYPSENNLFSHNGNPDETEFHCDTSRASGVNLCLFERLSSSNVRGS
jgi:hypothetical protein